MKDHEVQKIINQLRDVALQYGHTQQLRERISSIVIPAIKRLNKEKEDVCLLCEAPTDAHSWQQECMELREEVKKLKDIPSYKSDASPEQKEKQLFWMEKQMELICDQHTIGTPVRFVKVRCGCNKMVRIIEAYRCLYCGIFFCKECAGIHFGMKKE